VEADLKKQQEIDAQKKRLLNHQPEVTLRKM